MIRLESRRFGLGPIEFELLDGELRGPNSAEVKRIMETYTDGFFPPGNWYWQWSNWRELGHILAVLTFDDRYQLPAEFESVVTQPQVREAEDGVLY